MEEQCIRCKGKGLCGKPCKILAMFQDNAPKVKLHFSGPSPPEIFVGRRGYPNVNTGILAPTSYETRHNELNNAEDWAKNNLSIANVLRLRGQMVYGRTLGNIKSGGRIKQAINELALTHKSTDTEFFLKKKPTIGTFTPSQVFRPMTNPAPIKKVILQDNTKVHKKVDYLVNDSDILATNAINELKGLIKVDHLQKLLSAGLLGRKTSRIMVPTRWSITAIDDTLSKQLLEEIRNYKEIEEIQILKGNFLGNYINILILPGKFSFEAIEVWEGEESEGREHHTVFAQDYEGFYGRKTYASNITGGYYAMRLPICEYLTKIKKQGTVFILREITKEYYAPLGVGIVREATRNATKNQPIKLENKEQAVNYIQTRQKLVHNHLEKSWTLDNYGKQKMLKEFF